MSSESPVPVDSIGGKEPNGKPACMGRWTFETSKIRHAVERTLHGRVLNACAGKTKLRTEAVDEIVRNDINEERDADHHVDVCDIAGHFETRSFDVIVFDPPFTQKQADAQPELSSSMQTEQVIDDYNTEFDK